MTYIEKYYFLTTNDIATEEEIALVSAINGISEEQLDNILFVRTGYTSFEAYEYYETSYYDLFDDDDDDENDW